MTDLSPAAQAVWEAFNEDEAGVFVDYGDKLAAALRAAADQVMAPYLQTEDSNEFELGFIAGHIRCRITLLAIADELDPPSS